LPPSARAVEEPEFKPPLPAELPAPVMGPAEKAHPVRTKATVPRIEREHRRATGQADIFYLSSKVSVGCGVSIQRLRFASPLIAGLVKQARCLCKRHSLSQSSRNRFSRETRD
jgi:hypothetical protein